MIPLFPKFKKLELKDKKEIENFTKKFPPYSDYNFTSMWCYNTEDKMRISWLNDNLVVRFQDYITGEPFYSFLGTTKVVETASSLLDYSKKKGLQAVLKLIPEVVVKTDKKINELFSVKEDRDNFDYIYLIESLSNLKGKKYCGQRNKINKFKKKFPKNIIKLLSLKKNNTKEEILDLFFRWKKQKIKGKKNYEAKNELLALNRLLKQKYIHNIIIFGTYVNNYLISFTVVEKVEPDCCIIHFEKADISYFGIYKYLKQEIARYFNRKEFFYLNYQQDLGIPNLRATKMEWKHVKYLKKYQVANL